MVAAAFSRHAQPELRKREKKVRDKRNLNEMSREREREMKKIRSNQEYRNNSNDDEKSTERRQTPNH